MHIVKWFQVFLFSTNSFICWWEDNYFTHFFQTSNAIFVVYINIFSHLIFYSWRWIGVMVLMIENGLGLVSLFNGISTFIGYLMPKPFFFEGQYWYYLANSWGDEVVPTFPKGFCLKGNIIVQREFELAYYDMLTTSHRDFPLCI